tara:strand:- start:1361 stop:2014 length:654 start_codon:yes stop_codon:yes gene_type:complete
MVKDKNINKKKTKRIRKNKKTKNKKTKNKKFITKKVNNRTKKISIKKSKIRKRKRKILRGGLTYNNLIKKTPLKYIDRGYKSLKKKINYCKNSYGNLVECSAMATAGAAGTLIPLPGAGVATALAAQKSIRKINEKLSRKSSYENKDKPIILPDKEISEINENNNVNKLDKKSDCKFNEEKLKEYSNEIYEILNELYIDTNKIKEYNNKIIEELNKD